MTHERCHDGTHVNVLQTLRGCEVSQCECGERPPSPVHPRACPSCGVQGRWWEQKEPWRCSICDEVWLDERLREDGVWFRREPCPHEDCEGSYDEPWFDRSYVLDEDGDEVSGPSYVCSKCGRDV